MYTPAPSPACRNDLSQIDIGWMKPRDECNWSARELDENRSRKNHNLPPRPHKTSEEANADPAYYGSALRDL